MMLLDSVELLASGFSGPREAAVSLALNPVAAGWGAGLIEALLSHASDMRASVPDECKHALAQIRDTAARMSDVWHPEFGLIKMAIAEGDPSVEEAVAGGCLAGLANGLSGRFAIDLPTPSRLRWSKYSLPECVRLWCSCDAQSAEIVLTCQDGRELPIQFRRSQHDWVTDQIDRPRSIPSSPMICFATPGFVPESLLRRHGVDRWPVLERVTPELEEHFDAAMRLMRAVDPAYATWVERVITRVILSTYVKGSSGSGSWSDLPGCIYLSVYPHPAELAETLIHEAAHQYFNLITSVFPVDDGTDTRGYFSAAVKRERPIDRILIAYHAFANVQIFYQDCIAAGDSDSFLATRYEKTRRLVDDLENPLISTSALTECGRSLFNNLRRRRA